MLGYARLPRGSAQPWPSPEVVLRVFRVTVD